MDVQFSFITNIGNFNAHFFLHGKYLIAIVILWLFRDYTDVAVRAIGNWLIILEGLLALFRAFIETAGRLLPNEGRYYFEL